MLRSFRDSRRDDIRPRPTSLLLSGNGLGFVASCHRTQSQTHGVADVLERLYLHIASLSRTCTLILINLAAGRSACLLVWRPLLAGSINDPLPVINSEYFLWRRQWTATAAEQRPDIATAALSSCSSVKFPNVYRLLFILGTLPVTTYESERVFSKLQRTLTSIRSTMTEDRLEALLLLQCHRENCPNARRHAQRIC